jgi:hypothetical protein
VSPLIVALVNFMTVTWEGYGQSIVADQGTSMLCAIEHVA